MEEQWRLLGPRDAERGEYARVAGTAFGLLLLGGNIFGLTPPIITGYIVKTAGSFSSAFALAGAVALIGVVVSFTMTRRPIYGSLPDGVAVPVAIGH